jgi:coproporphyrinogen III oxidase
MAGKRMIAPFAGGGLDFEPFYRDVRDAIERHRVDVQLAMRLLVWLAARFAAHDNMPESAFEALARSAFQLQRRNLEDEKSRQPS